MTKTILLIHGAWLNAASWEGFKARYEAKGYTVVAPSWPHDDRAPADLRAAPDPRLATVGVAGIVDHYARIIRALPEDPIIIGHSAGGTFVQMLLDRGLGVAGVAIDPAPTPGVRLGWQTIRSALPVFTRFGFWRRTLTMSRRYFAHRFAQTLPAAARDAAYDRYIVPTAGKVYWDGVTNAAGKIAFDNPRRAPLLLIGGENDLIADPGMTRRMYAKQKRAPSKTELVILPGRSHWLCLDHGWEEVADLALGWAAKHARPGRIAPARPALAA
ncbi:MAG: alpha/beta hydrolase [Rhodospirillaceae bacterium]|nr:alpha/beta hydrolase [Rhodospirillaceae bacterium]